MPLHVDFVQPPRLPVSKAPPAYNRPLPTAACEWARAQLPSAVIITAGAGFRRQGAKASRSRETVTVCCCLMGLVRASPVSGLGSGAAGSVAESVFEKGIPARGEA